MDMTTHRSCGHRHEPFTDCPTVDTTLGGDGMTNQLTDLHDHQLRDLLDSMAEPAKAYSRGAFEMFHPIRYMIAEELMRRGHDDYSLRLIVNHGGHEVWTADDDGGWSVMCDCSWAVNDLPSIADADQHGEQHIAETGGCWQPQEVRA